jgi:aldehyde:ferredoxin oxidoreductase
MKGWTQKILRVDLTSRSYSVADLSTKTAEMFIGGHGVAAKILMDEIDPKVAPLSPDNKLIFSAGPLTGTAAVMGSRYMVTAKSPLTGLLGFANSGGYFGPAMKSAGYDHIIFEGRSDNPVYIAISGEDIHFNEASHLWGKDTHEAEDIIRKEVELSGKRARVACIGPAGEKQVKMAAIMNDKHRAAGRCGLGAVMGSKNLKAVVVQGTKKIGVADETALKGVIAEIMTKLKANPAAEGFREFGTAGGLMLLNEMGVFPTKNFQKSSFKGAVKVSGETLAEKYLVKKKSCFGCPVSCGRGTKVTDPGYEGEGEGPEYETIAMLGSNLEIENLAAITKANYICNQLGMDTISVGGTLACAMELFEKGYLTEEDTGGLEIRFGDDSLIVKLVELIGKREGFGDVLAEGGFKLAEKYGHPEVFMGLHKMELPGYEPRGAKGMGLNYMTSTIGPSHCRGYTVSMEIIGSPEKIDPITENGKAMVTKALQDMTAAWDATGLCLFGTLFMDPADTLAMLSAATGRVFVIMEFIKIGERIFNLQRLFNLKAGLKKGDERLPDRFYKEPLPDGPNTGANLSLNEALGEYYSLRGWDRNGIPYLGKLKGLGLAEYAVTASAGQE